MTPPKPFERRLRPSTNALCKTHECGLGTQEYNARKAQAEIGSRALLRAIRRHHPERVA